MSMGDCLFPMAHRFQAEFTRPQKDGTNGGDDEDKEGEKKEKREGVKEGGE